MVSGCVGDITTPQPLTGPAPDPGVTGPQTGPQTDPQPGGQCAPDAGTFAVPLQRLNQRQFKQMVSQLFPGIAADDTFPPAGKGAPYTTYSEFNPVTAVEVEPIMNAALAVAMAAADQVPACTQNEAACASTYLSALSARAFRREPAPDELAVLNSMYADARTSGMSYPESIGVAIFGLLQLPQFLYVLEDQPVTQAPSQLSQQEIGQRLALLFSNGLPDTELSASDLTDPAVRLAQARRLVSLDGGHAALAAFLKEWLGLDGFQSTVHTPEVKAALEEELARDLDDALAAPDGVGHLLSSADTTVNSVLEGFYGLPHTSTGPTDWRKVTLPAEQRVGVLTHPLLMARLSHGTDISFVQRGLFVRLKLLCDVIPPPPSGAMAAQNTLSAAGATLREQSQARLSSPACSGCHQQIDPIGYGFSAFDATGAFTSSADAAGNVTSSVAALSGPFSGVRTLGERLAQSPEGRACFATQWLRYSMGKTESSGERCAAQNISTRLASQSLALVDLFVSIVTEPAFVTRNP